MLDMVLVSRDYLILPLNVSLKLMNEAFLSFYNIAHRLLRLVVGLLRHPIIEEVFEFFARGAAGEEICLIVCQTVNVIK